MLAEAVAAELNAVELTSADLRMLDFEAEILGLEFPVSGDTLRIVEHGDYTQMIGRKATVNAEVRRGR